MAKSVCLARVNGRLFNLLYQIRRCEGCHNVSTYSRIKKNVQAVRLLADQCLLSQAARNSAHSRCYSSGTQEEKPAVIDPFTLAQGDLQHLCRDIRKELECGHTELQHAAQYLFDGRGKAFRPMVVALIARAVNTHNAVSERLLETQRQVAMIAEMIHTASLVHDDVIDASDTRRGKTTVHKIWGHRKAIMGGDYILSVASTLLARIRNEQVVEVLAEVLEDLVRGEFMQLGSKEDENERFSHYLKKTFKKTASLIALSSKAVAILSSSSEAVTEIAYQYGRNVGIAFQLVDDLLDFVSSDIMMGKPTAADLKLGLATGPVLFAAQKYPELNALIMRRFSVIGDVELARKLVAESDGVAQTRLLAEQHCKEAVRQITQLRPSQEREALVMITDKVLNRLK